MVYMFLYFLVDDEQHEQLCARGMRTISLNPTSRLSHNGQVLAFPEGEGGGGSSASSSVKSMSTASSSRVRSMSTASSSCVSVDRPTSSISISSSPVLHSSSNVLDGPSRDGVFETGGGVHPSKGAAPPVLDGVCVELAPGNPTSKDGVPKEDGGSLSLDLSSCVNNKGRPNELSPAGAAPLPSGAGVALDAFGRSSSSESMTMISPGSTHFIGVRSVGSTLTFFCGTRPGLPKKS